MNVRECNQHPSEYLLEQLKNVLGDISTSCEDKNLSWGSKDDLIDKLRAKLDYVWARAREAYASIPD